MINHYEKGQKVRARALFTVEDVATDPTSVLFKVRKPDDTTVTYTHPTAEITNPAVGEWRLEITADDDGKWEVRVEGQGAADAVGSTAFRVRPWTG